jgi:hypothetical protein
MRKVDVIAGFRLGSGDFLIRVSVEVLQRVDDCLRDRGFLAFLLSPSYRNQRCRQTTNLVWRKRRVVKHRIILTESARFFAISALQSSWSKDD